MTKEQKKEFLQYLKNLKLIQADDFFREGFDIAISALSEGKRDLISRQAVLDELEKWDWQELYLPIHFKQILDDVPSVENKGEWIPIKEREPEVHKYVMFTTKTTRREIGYKAKEEPYYFLFGDSGAYVKSDYILAWMELPEPYKAESEVKPNE